MRTTRRFVLRTTAAGLALAAAHPFRLCAAPLAGVARRKSSKKTIVAIFLRGGCDGLNLVAPYGDPRYATLRSYLAVRPPGGEQGAVDLDGYFGLNPAARALAPWFENGAAAAIHAVGYDGNTRSHFEEQDTWETGILGNTMSSDGWLNRHLATSEGHGPIRAVAVGESLPRILRGDARALALRSLDDLGRARSSAALAKAYAGRSEGEARARLEKEAETTIEALRTLERVAQEPYRSGAEYPQTDIARRLREVARLIKADLGLEVAELDYGGFDTHADQGAYGGPFHQLVQQLAEGVAAFAADMGDRLDDVLVLTLSEFGRTAAINGTGGTDHGWGNALLALGGPVRARAGERDGPVLGRWPGLAPEQLNQGRDLAHTTDFRAVLAEVVARHLGNEQLTDVLPGAEHAPVGLV